MEYESNNNPNSHAMHDAANHLAALNCSVIPVRFNKQPNVASWKPYQEKIPDAFQITDMFTSGTYGIAIIGGKVSANIEALDEDLKYDLTGTMHDLFKELLNDQAPGLYEKLLIQKTISGGCHYLYRCSEISGNLKLASRPASDDEQTKKPGEKVKVLYETRGEGGYFVCAPTQGYEVIQGSFDQIPEITSEEREILHNVARSFDQCQKIFEPQRLKQEYNFSGLSPFEDYNNKCDVVDLLQKHGWTVSFTKGSKVFLKRPGDTKASQSGNYDKEKNWFTVFSTSTEFETQKAYLPYAVFTILDCNGDFQAASKKLYYAGYGDRKPANNYYQNNTSRQPNNIDPNLDLSAVVINAVDLLKTGSEENRYLLKPIIPKIGTGVLAGMPDTGKSQFARQLCISVATGLDQFLEYGLTLTHKRALYIATEDDQHNTSFLLKQQLSGLNQNASENLSFIFADTLSQDEILAALDLHLTKTPCDLVIIDSYGDVFVGADSNNNTAMRQTVKNFDKYAKKHECFILFVHHVTKSSYKQAPHQMHIMGGAGLVQKARLALQLSQDESGIKYLTVVKGNYCPQDVKTNAMELSFDKDHFVFSRTGRIVPRESLNFESGKDKDTKFEKLVNRADEVLGNDSLTNTQFCKKYCEVTGKGIAQAKRDLKSMTEFEIVKKDDKLYSLNGTVSSIENPESDDPTPF